MPSDVPFNPQSGSVQPAIVVEGVTKIFSIFKRPSDRLLQMLSAGRLRYGEEFVALRNVNLTVAPGETVGIVGPNGSGKSTLLQIIAGLLPQNAGRVDTRGRVASLLELGAGFNPEFSGRENIHLNAAILGLTQAEIDARFDDIVAFSGLEPFIDRAVNTYSSGMYVRLAFSVAVSVDPDVLIVDEALAVGDEGFQRKCLARIDAMRDAGVTILFVSHAMSMVTQLCDRALLMDRGEVLFDGKPRQAASHYYRLNNAPANDRERIRDEILTNPNIDLEAEGGHDDGIMTQSRMEYESRGARISDPRVENMAGEHVNRLARNHRYFIRYTVDFLEDQSDVLFGALIKTKEGVELTGRSSAKVAEDRRSFKAGETVDVSFEFSCALVPGTYFLNTGVSALVDSVRTPLHRVLDAVMFQVMPEENSTVLGVIDIGMDVSVERR